ncbi:response regulator [Paenibacillus rhizoplanae]
MLKVLFADDEPLMLEGLRFLVDWEKLNFEVCGEALDGEDALALIHSTRPDLVITDVRMPVIDGLELIRRTSESDCRPKFIIFLAAMLTLSMPSGRLNTEYPII